MTILRERKTWAKHPQLPTETKHSSDLTPAEQANARRALRFLRDRLGTTRKLATALKARFKTVENMLSKRCVTAGVALRVARLAEVPLEELLAGRWPPQTGVCQHCGRGP